ncbi:MULTISPECIES: hypothetical protein [Marinobacter]|uniref:hypothetical protein n=1 Tax=Marinobacter TaxID=2742 RepID=UPI0005A0395E|nr:MULTISPECIES: hypothetical protein [Marinobacter]
MSSSSLAIFAAVACALTGLVASLGVAYGNLESIRLLWVSFVSLACLPLTMFLAWCAYQELTEN